MRFFGCCGFNQSSLIASCKSRAVLYFFLVASGRGVGLPLISPLVKVEKEDFRPGIVNKAAGGRATNWTIDSSLAGTAYAFLSFSLYVTFSYSVSC